MADEESRTNQKKQTTKSKGKSKARWRKPGNLLKIGNKEKGEHFYLLQRILRDVTGLLKAL